MSLLLKKEGSYEMGGYESSGTIRVYVFVDLDGVIVYVGLPEAFLQSFWRQL